MSKNLSTTYNKIARDLVKKYDNKKPFQAQGDKFEYISERGYYEVNLQGLGTAYVVRGEGGSICVSDTNNIPLSASKDGSVSQLYPGSGTAGVAPGLVYFAEAIATRLYNNENSGDNVKLFVGSNVPVKGLPDIRLSATLHNFSEADGYRPTKITFAVGDSIVSQEENESEGLSLKETTDFINTRVAEFTKEKAGEYFNFYKGAMAEFVTTLHRIYNAEGRTVDVVEED